MSIIRYHAPVRDFAPLSFGSLMDRFFSDDLATNGGSQYSFMPRVNVLETDKAFEIQLAVPGMKKDEFNIDLNQRVLTISGERKGNPERKDVTRHVTQIPTGTFSRVFTLPEAVNESAITAEYHDGILEVVIPKDEKLTAKRTIQVK